jgi:hypothetical protein
MTLQYERGLVGMGFNPSIYPLRYALPNGLPLSAYANASEKHTSGVKTPFPEYHRIAGDQSPAYRPMRRKPVGQGFIPDINTAE